LLAGPPLTTLNSPNEEICMQRVALALILAVFSVLSAVALWQHGYWGLFQHQLVNSAGLQVLADLGIALTLVMTWLWRDARQHGRNPWLWLVATMALGSFGPLIYLVTRPTQPRASAAEPAAPSLAGR
jgi:hypothetical protein